MKSPTDGVSVTTVIDVDPATAFEVFTSEIDVWWKRAPRYRFGAERSGSLCFETRAAGGRLIEVYDSARRDVFEIGRVTVWDPPHALAFEWRTHEFGPGERTEVEVTFEAVERRTRVTIAHRGWDALRADHPARHAHKGDAFTSMVGLWWADLAVAFRAHLVRTRARRAKRRRPGQEA